MKTENNSKEKSFRKSRVLKFVLIISLAVILVAGVSLGLYFLLRDKEQVGLSQSEKDFGAAINAEVNVPVTEEIIINQALTGLVVDNVVLFSSNYIVSQSQTGFKIYNNQNGTEVQIEDVVSINQVLELKNSALIAETNNGVCLINLNQGKSVGTINDVNYKIVGDHIVLFSKPGLNFSLNLSGVQNSLISIVDTNSFDVKYTNSDVNNFVNLAFIGDRVLLKTTQQFSLVNLVGKYEVLISLEANGQVSENYNIKGFHNKFRFENYYNFNLLNENLFLIEQNVISSDNRHIKVSLESGSQIYLAKNYFVFDCNTKNRTEISSNNKVVRPHYTTFNNKYFAVIECEIEENQISGTNQIISYYEAVNSKKGLKLNKIVSYDYVKYGAIVSFNNDKLLTSGGENFGILDFNGNNSSSQSEKDNFKVVSVGENLVSYTSLSGMFGLMDKAGNIIHAAAFIRLSPIINGKAVAYDGYSYYLLSKDGKVKIENFAKDYAQYIFAGIGYYIIDNNGSFDVVDYNQVVVYDDCKLVITYNEGSNELYLKVDNQKAIKITPLEIVDIEDNVYKDSQSVNTVIDNQNYGTNFEPEISKMQNAIAPGSLFKSSLEREGVTFTIEEDDEGLNLATLNVKGSIDLSLLTYSLGIASLTQQQTSFVPAGDETLTLGDIVYTDGVNEYKFSGAHYLSATNMMVAILKLTSGSDIKYVAAFAFKDMYLSSLKADFGGTYGVGYLNGHISSVRYYSGDPHAANRLNGSMVLSSTDSVLTRTVAYNSAGFDGGLVFASVNNSSILNIDMTVKNAYYGPVITEDIVASSEDIDINKDMYSIEISAVSNGLRIYVNAKDGFFLNNIQITYYYSDGSDNFVYGDPINRTGIRTTSGRINITEGGGLAYDLRITFEVLERYSNFKVVHNMTSTERNFYHFYGYKEGTNPADFGFVDQEFYRLEKLTPDTQRGHTLLGYQLPETTGENYNISRLGVLDSNNYFGTTLLTYQFTSVFEANNYTITFDPKCSITVSPSTATVTFGQPVGNVLVTPTRAGYDFMGWYYNSIKFEPTTIYDYDTNITLEAQWQAKQYTVTFDINTSRYGNNQLVNGVMFNIDHAKFRADYAQYGPGETVPDTLTKTVTFDQIYNDIPNIFGYNLDEKQRYILTGWSTDVNGTNVVTYSTIYTIADNSTLYAQYKREAYVVTFSLTGEENAKNDDGTVMPINENIGYTGINALGVLGTYNTADGNWAKVDDVYKAYGYQGDSLGVGFTLNVGYYIGSINISIYNTSGLLKVIAYNGDWNPITGVYNLTGDVNTETSAAMVDRTCDLTFNCLNDAYINGDDSVYAMVTIQEVAKEYLNKFKLTQPAATINKNGVEFLTSGSKDDVCYYNTSNIYTLLSKTAVTPDNVTTQTTYLKGLKIDSTIINFDFEYYYDNARKLYYHKLSPIEGFTLSSSWVGNSFVQQGQINADVKFIMNYNINTQSYSYVIQTKNKSTHTFDIYFEGIKYNLLLETVNQSDQAPDNNGVSVLSSVYKSPGDIGNQYNLVAGRVAIPNNLANYYSIFEINVVNPKYFIQKIEMVYDGDTIVLAQTNSNITTPELKANSKLSISSNTSKLQSTKTQIIYNGGSKFALRVGWMVSDVQIKVYYYEYTRIDVTVPYQDDSVFDVVVNQGHADYTGKSLKDLSASNEQIKIERNGTTYSYYVLGNETNILSYNVNSQVTQNIAYKITSATSLPTAGDISINQTLSQASFTANSYHCTIKIEVARNLITIASYLGHSDLAGEGFDGYLLDPLAGLNVLSHFVMSYYTYNETNDTSTAAETSYADFKTSGLKTIPTIGSLFSVKLWQITGYTLESVVLTDASKKIEVTPVSTEGNNYVYSLTDLSSSTYTFKVKYRAHKYTVNYDSVDFGDNVTEGTTPSSTHYYNVKSNLSVNEFSRIGYNYIGYSVESVTGSDLSTSDVDYTSGQLLEDNLTSEDNGNVTLYAVFAARRYLIFFNYNDFLGIKAKGTTSQYYKTFDHTIGSLYIVPRTNFEFIGWFTHEVGGTQLTADTIFDINLYNVLKDNSGLIENDPNGTIIFYAQYKYKFSCTSDSNAVIYGTKIDDLNNYDHTTTDKAKANSGSVSGVEYGKDVIFDYIVESGKFLKTLSLSYKTGTTGQALPFASQNILNISFEWISNQLNVKVNVGSSGYKKIDLNTFVKVDNARTRIYDGLYIKILPYNSNGADTTNCVSDACRVIIAIDHAETSIDLENAGEVQTFTIYYYRKTGSGSAYDGETWSKTVDYNYKFVSEDFNYAYTPGYTFDSYYYGTNNSLTVSSSNQVLINDVVKVDTNITAYYTTSTSSHKVNFYYWSKAANAYVLNSVVSSNYILGYYDGSNWVQGDETYYDLDSNLDSEGKNIGGHLVNLPTPSFEDWPLEQFAGYVICSYQPSKYLMYGSGSGQNATGLREFNLSTIIEGEINVYATYASPYLKTVVSGTSTFYATADYLFFDLQENGEVHRIKNTDISFINLNYTQYNAALNSLAAGDSIEVAIAKAISYNFTQCAYSWDLVPSHGIDGVSDTIVVAVLLKVNESGHPYIYTAAKNYVRIFGGEVINNYW